MSVRTGPADVKCELALTIMMVATICHNLEAFQNDFSDQEGWGCFDRYLWSVCQPAHW